MHTDDGTVEIGRIRLALLFHEIEVRYRTGIVVLNGIGIETYELHPAGDETEIRLAENHLVRGKNRTIRRYLFMKKIFTQIAVAFGCMFLAGCDSVFDVHPYDVHVDGDKNVNATNIAKIESAIKNKDTIRFAMISDTHQWLDDLKKEVNDINRRKDSIDFVLHCGDVTDFGATQEFLWTRDRLQKLKMPFVVLLGNHDCLGTGNQTYGNRS